MLASAIVQRYEQEIKVSLALLQCVSEQSKLRTRSLTPNVNKSFSVGTMLFIDEMYERLRAGRDRPAQGQGRPDGRTCQGHAHCKLGENFSILQASEWMNRPEILRHYEVQNFNERTLYRAVELLGRDRERTSASSRTASWSCSTCHRPMLSWTGPASSTTAI